MSTEHIHAICDWLTDQAHQPASPHQVTAFGGGKWNAPHSTMVTSPKSLPQPGIREQDDSNRNRAGLGSSRTCITEDEPRAQ